MTGYRRVSAAPVLAALAACALSLSLAAQEPSSRDGQLREGDALLSSLRYEEAIAAYQRARASDNARVRVRAGLGVVRAMLRMGMFADAEREGAAVEARDPESAAARAAHGDSLWASGMFFEAEALYDAALAMDAAEPVALHGRARSLAARWRLDEALDLARRAASLDPGEPTYLYTLFGIHEQRHDFAAAADTLARYLLLLPAEEDSHLTKWARTQERFLRSFGRRVPFEMVSREETYTVPIRIANGRVLVDGSINGRTAVEFALDTGTDQTILTPALASRAGIASAATLQTAGVGSIGLGFRDLELARIDDLSIGDLRMRNVPSVIKSPALMGLPRPEGAGFSPLALGFSMVVDYERRVLTMARRLPEEVFAARLPLRMQRLPILRATVNGATPASFAIDTAGEGNALSRRVARRLDVSPDLRLVSARVFGSAGWDPTAFLLPFVDIHLAPGIVASGGSVVVLNLDAPSGLLGFELGGIIGHDFLQRYRVAIDLNRSEVGLQPVR